MRIARNMRNLSEPEEKFALSIFDATLPPWKRIFITDGLGFGDAPWTDHPTDFIYQINMGPVGYPNAIDSSKDLTTPRGKFGSIRDNFIHEMVHVWQYFHGSFVKTSSLWSHVSGGYIPVLGKDWDDYNVEQQAVIVGVWYLNGMNASDPAYRYIKDYIRKGKTS